MKFRIIKSFAKDLKKINDKNLLKKVKKISNDVKEIVKNIENEDEIPFNGTFVFSSHIFCCMLLIYI